MNVKTPPETRWKRPPPDPIGDWFSEFAADHFFITVFALLALVGATILFPIAYFAAPMLDASGLLSHRVTTMITAPSTWMVGETRVCTAIGADTFSYVDCGSGEPRTMRITFWGRQHQPEKPGVVWACTRNDSSFTCKEK